AGPLPQRNRLAFTHTPKAVLHTEGYFHRLYVAGMRYTNSVNGTDGATKNAAGRSREKADLFLVAGLDPRTALRRSRDNAGQETKQGQYNEDKKRPHTPGRHGTTWTLEKRTRAGDLEPGEHHPSNLQEARQCCASHRICDRARTGVHPGYRGYARECADKYAPVKSSSPVRNAQNMRLTDSANGP